MEINGFQPDYWENSNGIFHVLRLLCSACKLYYSILPRSDAFCSFRYLGRAAADSAILILWLLRYLFYDHLRTGPKHEASHVINLI